MIQGLSQRDQKVIWHPYTQHKDNILPIPIISAEGSLLFDEEGKSYIDAISSWWVNIHGHSHPYIASRIYEQAGRLEHVIFTGFTHEPAVTLAERLLPILPGSFEKIFYSDNGSTAVEVALKMAIQFWQNKGGAGAVRNKILAFRNSYHGDTFGAMSVSERSIFTAAFSDYLFEVIFIDTPTAENLDSLDLVLKEYSGQIACFIYEPLLQAAGGMHMYEAKALNRLLTKLKEQEIICIADEVMTGFGRTGKLFAGEYLDETADIICLSKGITGGTMALGATACSGRIFDAFLSSDKRKTLFHGHSFTANPIACAASLASLDLLLDPTCLSRIQTIQKRNHEFIKRIISLPEVKNPRNIGTVMAFEWQSEQGNYLNSVGQQVTKQALESGIYLRPLGNCLYIMPAYCIKESQLDQVYEFLIGLVTT